MQKARSSNSSSPSCSPEEPAQSADSAQLGSPPRGHAERRSPREAESRTSALLVPGRPAARHEVSSCRTVCRYCAASLNNSPSVAITLSEVAGHVGVEHLRPRRRQRLRRGLPSEKPEERGTPRGQLMSNRVPLLRGFAQQLAVGCADVEGTSESSTSSHPVVSVLIEACRAAASSLASGTARDSPPLRRVHVAGRDTLRPCDEPRVWRRWCSASSPRSVRSSSPAGPPPTHHLTAACLHHAPAVATATPASRAATPAFRAHTSAVTRPAARVDVCRACHVST